MHIRHQIVLSAVNLIDDTAWCISQLFCVPVFKRTLC